MARVPSFSEQRGFPVEVKIGVQNAVRELVLESDQTPDQVTAAIDEAVAAGGTLRLTDDKGRLVIVPASVLAYVELGAPETRRVGFGGI